MAKVIEVYECPVCRAAYKEWNDALECCTDDFGPYWQCSKCKETYLLKGAAQNCCHDDCPKCGHAFDDLDYQNDGTYKCRKCEWKTGDELPATKDELEKAGQGVLL